jgi:histidine triad (HIT) family protein
MSEKTIFQKIIDRELPGSIIYEDNKHIAFLDIQPFEKGHTLVVTKEPHETIFDMNESQFIELMSVVKKVAEHVKQELGSEGMNIAQNNYPISGQVVPHVHFHIIPRSKNKNLYSSEHDSCYEEGEIDQWRERLSMID